ncbi:MAG: hypothetical protein ACJAY5_000912 [Actinomycetes bacterium]|jgi:hypothetical protein
MNELGALTSNDHLVIAHRAAEGLDRHTSQRTD